MRVNLKGSFCFNLIVIIFVASFIFIGQAKGQQLLEKSQIVTQETSSGTRIIISASGAAKFSSYWLDVPPRLIVKFQTKNIVSKMDKEVIVDQGVIKRITSSYYGGRRRSLKSLTFELTEKVPYRVWQENNTILLDIQTPEGAAVFSLGEKEIFAVGEASETIIKRLEAMDAALMQLAEDQVPLKVLEASLEPPEVKPVEEISPEIAKVEEEIVSPTIIAAAEESARQSKAVVAMVFWLAGLTLVSGLGFLIWRRYKLDIDQQLKKVKLQLEEKDELLQKERFVRKTVEETSLQREKEYQQLRGSFESLKGELRGSFESLKGELIEKGLLERELSPEEKEKLWISGKSQEKRQFSRLTLSHDYNRTIILRIESPDREESIKTFANNISSNGLCFESKEELKEKEPVNIRLFFYGDVVPMMKVQAHIVRRKEVEPFNCYGVNFDLVEEKDKLELNRYIESKISET